jgi:hypothetical protein
MRAPLLLFVWTSGVLLELAPCRASAQNAAGFAPRVAVSGSCPESSALETVLAGLLPAKPLDGPEVSATVADLGESYTVTVGDQVKTYADATRDCAGRARVAAAFIALELAPDASSPSDTKPAGPTPPARPPPETARPRSSGPLWVRIDARGTLDSAPASGLFAPGLAFGVAVGRGKFGGQAMCGWISGSSLNVGSEDSTVRIERFPCALGPMLRLYPTARTLEVSVAASLVLGALVAEGAGFASNYESVRFEVGGRGSVDAALHLGGPVVPVIGIEATYDPMAYDLVVVPRGVVAHTPSFWAGASAGVCWSIP